MPEFNKIQPALRVHPTLQEQRVIQKRKNSNRDKKKDDQEQEQEQEQEQGKTQDQKVDEYI